jgi:hypothetical protein
MSGPTTKARLGDRLLERGLITSNQLGVALSEQKRAYRPLGQILDLASASSASRPSPQVDRRGRSGFRSCARSQLEPDPAGARLARPATSCEATGAFPIELVKGDHLLVAMLDPDSPEKVSARAAAASRTRSRCAWSRPRPTSRS